MAEFRLHCFAQSGNAYKVALMLELSGADWEPVLVDFFAGGTREPAFRAMNPMGEVPVLEHRGEVLTQSGVILDYLAEVLGTFGPAPERAREVLRWILWDNHKLTANLATWRFLARFVPEEKRNADVIAFLEGRARTALKLLDQHLQARDWIVGDAPTIADLSCAGYMFYPEEYPIDWQGDFPAVSAWAARIAGLPGWKYPYDLMPGHPIGGR